MLGCKSISKHFIEIVCAWVFVRIVARFKCVYNFQYVDEVLEKALLLQEGCRVFMEMAAGGFTHRSAKRMCKNSSKNPSIETFAGIGGF